MILAAETAPSMGGCAADYLASPAAQLPHHSPPNDECDRTQAEKPKRNGTNDGRRHKHVGDDDHADFESIEVGIAPEKTQRDREQWKVEDVAVWRNPQ